MSSEIPKPQKTAKQPLDEWTPRALQVIFTARGIASPARGITPEDLLLALESVALAHGANLAIMALTRVGCCPSNVLRRSAAVSCPTIQQVCADPHVSPAEFDSSLAAVFPAAIMKEVIAMGDLYVGTEHLLLCIARIGVPGVDLPYERIRQIIFELRGKS